MRATEWQGSIDHRQIARYRESVRPVTQVNEFDRVFTEVFDRESPSLLRYMTRLCGDADLAADFTQEAFVRLYQRGSIPSDSRAWLATVSTNLLRDDQRTAGRRAQLAENFNFDIAPQATEQPDSIVERSERQFAVRTALSKLPMRDRQLLLLRHAGFSYREIGTVVGVAPTSVGTLIVRATASFFAICEGDLVTVK